MALRDIVVPDTRPETEWVRGRALQKLSPTRSHALLQAMISAALIAWCGARGEVGSEWRFLITPPGKPTRPLVPDVAFVRIERLVALSERDLEVPRLAPDAVFEILSPDDRLADVADKIATYLPAGCSLVAIVDPQTRTVELHDSGPPVVLGEHDVLSHPALPGFTLALASLFAKINRPRRQT